jgi:hypothetical protein
VAYSHPNVEYTWKEKILLNEQMEVRIKKLNKKKHQSRKEREEHKERTNI